MVSSASATARSESSIGRKWRNRPDNLIKHAILLLFLLVMNGIAIYLRNKFEKKW